MVEAVRRFELAGRTFVSSYYFGTARAVAATDSGVRVGFTVPRRIFRISDQGRGAPLGRLALRTLRRVTPPLVRPLLGGDSRPRCRPPPLAGDEVERARRARARSGRGHVDRRRSGDPRACGRGGSRRRGDERSSDIHVYTGNVKAAVRLSGALLLVACALLGFAAAFGLTAKAGAGTDAPAQATEPPTTTQPTEPTPTEPPVEPPGAAPIAFGVTVGGVKVGGLMPYRAGKAVQKAYIRPLRLVVDETRTIELAPGALGAKPNVPKAIRRARFARPGAIVPLDVEVSQARVRRYVERLGSDVDREAIDARIALDGDEAARGRVAGRPASQATRLRSFDPDRLRDEQPRADPPALRRHEAEGRLGRARRGRRHPPQARTASSSSTMPSSSAGSGSPPASPHTRRPSATTRS